jgi:diaminohydroxyphosphoribosylaminopyrimidine deaminase / 5-amino-6-(5-phosphoribosylamino)uracil reductase
VSFSEFDQRCMLRALELAERGLNTTDPNPRVGSVVAREQKIIGEGWHERAGEAHAEIVALRAAGEASRGADIYVTLEPCTHVGRTPPCVDALLKAGVGRVVCAMVDPNPLVRGSGVARLRDAGVKVESGLSEAEARALNPGFIRRMERGLPWVRVKLGASLDGRTALADGESRWITSEESRADVQQWRARSSVILTGSGTVVKDNPRLDARSTPSQAQSRQPLRVVLDSELRIPLDARILDAPGRALIFTSADASRRTLFEARGVAVEILRRDSRGLDLSALMQRLAQMEVNEIWVESGPRLAGALLGAGLVNEIVTYLAPSVLGSTAQAMFELEPLASLRQRVKLRFTDVRRIGPDIRIVAAYEE